MKPERKKYHRIAAIIMIALLMITVISGTVSAGQDATDAVTESNLSTTREYNNTNMISSLGKFCYADGYMYFYDHGLDNDGSVNGQPDSVNIYRISQEEGAEAELIKILPSPVEAGTVQSTAPILIAGVYEGKIYYLNGFSEDILNWISVDGNTSGVAELNLPAGEKGRTNYILDLYIEATLSGT